jgi:hypothetical protein
MKKALIIISILAMFAALDAKTIRRGSRAMLEIGPKLSLYIGEDAYFGLGAEIVANPVSSLGVRFNMTEVIFGNGTEFYFNGGSGQGFGGSSLDLLYYIPMQQIEPYIHGGLGFVVYDPPGGGDSWTTFSFRAGMGFNFALQPKTNLFVEPGILLYDTGDTHAMFRLSFGVRFGVL